jgi:AraC family transcriptional regulator
VNDLSAVVQMNPSTFARRFKQAFGVTPYRYVMRERVITAKRLIVQGDMTTNQIATELGFASQSHLLKVFRQFVGVTPGQFRAEL